MADRIAQTAEQATYGVAAATTLLGFNVDEWGIIGIIFGICLGIATFLVNWRYRHKVVHKDE